MIDIGRRAALRAGLGAGAALLAPRAAFAQTARRGFTILRDGDDIGRHVIAMTRDGDRLRVSITVDIAVRVLGLVVYRYEMRNDEVWEAGSLISVDSRVNDDGDEKRVRVTRDGGALSVDAPGFNGSARGTAVTTTYFTTAFLSRPIWISTDDGALYEMRTEKLGRASVETAGGSVECDSWRADGGPDYRIELFYDDRGEWASVAFDAGGERAVYVPDDLDQSLSALWTG